ncbi:MAG: LamG domain-containing protein, partial [Gammaproteobacteria bacterium]|nr:LamG domain-containing protein [Gammaproteobacteria bacterium]
MHKTILNRNSHHGHHQPQRNSVLSYLLLGFMLTGLAACGGGDDTQQNPGSGSASLTSPAYDGPVARDAQVLGYQNNVWERLRGEGACGRCHRSDAGIKQPPYFVDWLNVNNAYDAMIAYSPALVNLAEPEKSRLVTKVAEGHNCWLPSAAACATLITSYIESWASGSGGEAGRAIDLKPPTTLREPAATRFFPATFDGTNPGYTTVLNVPNDTDDYSIHSMLTTHCSGCHRSTAPDPQAPYFADPDPQTSYEAAQTKMDLNNPANSSFVLRLAAGHQIWDTAQNNSQDMQFLIEQFAGGITPNQVNNPETVSKALRFEEAVIASGGNRYEANQIALYEFRTGSGNTIVDTSGVMPELNLTLEGAEAPAGTRNGDYRWLTTYGVEFISPQAFAHATVANSKKLNDLIKLSGEYSIEAWVIPGNVTQENSNIVSYSAGTASEDRNFTLGQTMYNYDFIQLSSTTTDPFNDTLSTADAAERAQATLQHVVVTFDPINGRRIYVNGEYTGDADTSAPGNFADWNDGFALLFGGDSGGTRPWLGTLRMVSIHNRALNDAQIQQNYAVGVGQKYFMMFGVSHLTGTMGDPDYVGDAYVVFEVSQFDDYSYLFAKPRFLTKDTSLTPADINLNMRGMRIGVNGSLARVGQAYSTLDLTIGGGNYDPAEGQLLSPMGTILELKQGQQYDDFYLA